MEQVVVKRRTFNILETLSDNSFKVERKNKVFFLKKFNSFSDYEYCFERRKKFINNGIKVPKIIKADKKALSIIFEYVEGQNVLEMLYNAPLPENVYKAVFMMNYLARLSKIMLDFDPSNYIYTDDGKLYYMGLKYFEYDEKTSFVQKGIRLWFYTKEFSNLLLEKGHQIDKTRLKDDYVINKEIVLMTVKYYN